MPDRLVFRGARRFDLVEAPAQEPAEGEARIEVTAAGICGSDVHGYLGVNDRRPAGTVMGHEVAGRVSEAGPGLGLAVGEEVALWPIVACGHCEACAGGRPNLCESRRVFGCVPELPGGFSSEMVVPAANLVPLPAGVSAELGALVEPLAVGLHAVRLVGAPLGRVSVSGGGPIGIAAAIAAAREGADEVIVVEPVEARRTALERIGLETRVPGRAPRLRDTVVECVGLEATVRAAIDASRPGGTVVMVGMAEPEVTIPIAPLVIEERRLVGSSAYSREDFEATVATLADPGFDLAAIVEARVALADVPAAFEAYAAGESAAIKTLVVPKGG